MVRGAGVERHFSKTSCEWGFKGAVIRSFDRWVQGERSLPLVINRRNDWMAWNALDACGGPGREGPREARSGPPWQDRRCNTTHILRDTLTVNRSAKSESWGTIDNPNFGDDDNPDRRKQA